MTIPLVSLYADNIPSRSEPLTFRVDGDNFNAYFGVIGVDINATATEMNNTAITIDADKVAAAASATDSATSAGESATSAELSAGSANFKGTWASQTGAATKPAAYLHNGFYWNLLNNLADITVSEPGVSGDYSKTSVIAPWLIGQEFLAGQNAVTPEGNIWKAAITNTGNDPSTDDGTNWLPSVDSSKLQLINIVNSPTTGTYTREAQETTFLMNIDADITLDNTFSVGDVVIVDKPVKTTSGSITIGSGAVFDEDNINVGQTQDLDAGDSLTVKLTKVASSWRMRVY